MDVTSLPDGAARGELSGNPTIGRPGRVNERRTSADVCEDEFCLTYD